MTAAQGGAAPCQTRGEQSLDRYGNAIMGTFGRPQRVLTKGEGSYVWDADGNRYLDLLGGIAVNALGHADPEWVAAITLQASTLAHVSNFFATEPQIALAERLIDICGAPEGSRVFLANSGTEANEAAFKMSRRTGRTRILALDGVLPRAHHGRAGLDVQGVLSEPLRAACPRGRVGAGERRRGPHVSDGRRCRRDLHRTHPGRGGRQAAHPRVPRAPRASCATPTAPSSSPTRCRPASPAPGRGLRCTLTASRPTSSPSPRASAAASHWRRRGLRPEGGDASHRGPARQHLRWQPARFGRSLGDARRDRLSRAARAREGDG